MKPEPWCDHFGGDALAIEAPFQLLRLAEDLLTALAVNVRHRVIIVKHHRLKTMFFELLEFPIKWHFPPRRRAVRILARTQVPRAETKFVAMRFGHGPPSLTQISPQANTRISQLLSASIQCDCQCGDGLQPSSQWRSETVARRYCRRNDLGITK
jgi:hypothetical protein